MAKDVNVRVSSGIGCGSFAFLLTLVFVVMKILGYIDRSWWWVASPALITLTIWILLGVFVVGLSVILTLTDKE